MNKKFRIWSKLEHKFVDDRLIDVNGKIHDWVGGTHEVEIEPEPHNWPNSDGSSMYIVQLAVEKVDSKGDDIYEGDIVYYQSGDEHEIAQENHGEVYYDGETASFLFDRVFEYSWFDSVVHFHTIKIIGNICESPDKL